MTLVLERADWHMRIARPLYRHTAMPVSEVYVHQTAGRDPVEQFPTGDDHPEDAFNALNEYAIVGKGYSAVDYSILVHTGPSLRTTIGVARGEYVPAATLDRNTESKAVCLLGWYGPPDPRYPWTAANARVPFVQELEAIAEAILLMHDRGWVVKNPLILGHRDNPEHPGATTCPGDWLHIALPSIRARYLALLASREDTDMAPRYFTLVGKPSTLWVTTDNVNATRLEWDTANARGVLSDDHPLMSEEEARTFIFHGGLPYLSVR